MNPKIAKKANRTHDLDINDLTYEVYWHIKDDKYVEYIANCIQIVWCKGYGKTEQEAIEDAKDNANCYFEYRKGLGIPIRVITHKYYI